MPERVVLIVSTVPSPARAETTTTSLADTENVGDVTTSS
jgi:hypothetical protein